VLSHKVFGGWLPTITTEKVSGLLVHTCEPLTRRFDEVITFGAGLSMGGWLFEDVMKHLAVAGYKTRAVTFRGHTGSRRVEDVGNLTIENYAEDWATIVDHYDEDVITAAHSMAGLVAPKVAKEYSKVKGHISMASAPPRGVISGTEMLRYVGPHLKNIFGCRPVVLDYMAVANLFYNRSETTEMVSGFHKLCPESGRVIREIITMKHSMPKLSCPVLSVAGKYDVITPHQRRLSHQLGATDENIVVMESDHMLPKRSTAGELASVIDRWVTSGFNLGVEMKQAA
jgi:pimeloyl-ACP methyl ester carboxylesterase